MIGGPSFADENPKAEAQRQYELGAKEFHLGRFESALKALTRSYELYPSPVSLFNRAQALRLLRGHDEEAIFAYKQYVTLSPDGNFVQISRDMIAQLQKAVSERKPGDTAQAVASTPPVVPKAVEDARLPLVPTEAKDQAPPRRRSWLAPTLGIVVGVVVVGGAAAGVGVGVSSSGTPVPDSTIGHYRPVFQ